MAYLIYNKDTFKIFRKPNGDDARYVQERTAKAQFTKFFGKDPHPRMAIIESDKFYEQEPMVTVEHLLSGKEVQIRASQRGGCCDPSTERYHTM